MIWQAFLATVKCEKLGPRVHDGSMLIIVDEYSMVAEMRESEALEP